MEITEIKTRVKKAVANVLEMDQTEISDDANFIFDLGAYTTLFRSVYCWWKGLCGLLGIVNLFVLKV